MPDRDLDEATMSLGDHLEELRKRVLLAGAPAVPVAVVLFFFSNSFIRILVLPLRRVLEAEGLPPELQNLAPPEMLVVKMKLSFIFAAVLLAPWILYQAWLFIRPGLYVQERRFVHFLVPGSAILTTAGVCLLYFVMLPLMLQVLVSVGSNLNLGSGSPDIAPAVTQALQDVEQIPVMTHQPEQPADGQVWLLVPEMELYVAAAGQGGIVTPILVPQRPKAAITQVYRVSTYVHFVLLLLVGIVVAFQMPLVILLLGWMGLASADWLASNRRYALFICGGLSALLTPADVVSMLMLMIPLYLLYELGILLLRIAPAASVAEGSIWSRPKSDNGGSDLSGQDRDTPDKPDPETGQTITPAQSTTSIARSPGGPDRNDEPASNDAEEDLDQDKERS